MVTVFYKFFNKGDVRTFLGKVQFFGSFIKHLGEPTGKLYALLKNDIPEKWKYDHWKPHHTAAVKELKEALVAGQQNQCSLSVGGCMSA